MTRTRINHIQDKSLNKKKSRNVISVKRTTPNDACACWLESENVIQYALSQFFVSITYVVVGAGH